VSLSQICVIAVYPLCLRSGFVWGLCQQTDTATVLRRPW